MLNAGMLLIKCSPWMTGFLHRVYDARKFDSARALDQSSFQEHLNNLTQAERDLHVKVVPKYAMNVYTEEYRPGDFLLHMAGKLYESTEPGLFAIANQFDVLSMTDDIEDIKAFFRGQRLLNYYSGVCRVTPGERQSACKPEDPRRIILKESLGSMSTPNRYRHVGLRYYWLGNWEDKYDVPGWDVKRKALPMPDGAPVGKEMPALPLSVIHHELPKGAIAVKDESGGGAAAQKDGPGEQNGDAAGGPHHGGGNGHHDVPEVNHDMEDRPIGKDRDENEDDDESDSWPLWVRELLFGLGALVIGAFIFLYKKRKQKVSKMQ